MVSSLHMTIAAGGMLFKITPADISYYKQSLFVWTGVKIILIVIKLNDNFSIISLDFLIMINMIMQDPKLFSCMRLFVF